MREYKLTLLYKKGLDYKTRNLIALIILLILTIIVSYLFRGNLVRENEELLVSRTKLQTELRMLQAELATEPSLRNELEKLREELFLTDKVMPNLNNSTITLSYIFDIFHKYRNNFHFNFRLVNSGIVENDPDVNFIRYSITGQAYINLLYVLIDQLERQPLFLTIETINLGTLRPEEQGKVNFNIEFQAYYTSTGVPYHNIALKDLRERRLVYNIFYPRIHDPMHFDTEEFRELLDISEIIVVGMTPQRLFIRNRRTGNIEVLYEGDKIRYGTLQRLDWENQEAIFRINPTGISEDIRLKIEAF
jgi:cell division protein FtsL